LPTNEAQNREVIMPRLLKMRGTPRPYQAGRRTGQALRETANILYLLDNHEQYLHGIKDEIDHALDIVNNQITRKAQMNQ